MYFPVELTKDDNDKFLVTCPLLPEVNTFGATGDEAYANAASAIEEALVARMADFVEIPIEKIPPTAQVVRVRLPISSKVLLHRALRDSGMTRAEVARRLGWHRTQVERLFDPNHNSKLQQFDAAFAVLGRQPELRV